MAGGRSSIIGHIPGSRRQVMLQLIDWRRILLLILPSFSSVETSLYEGYHVAWLRIIWNWHGNVSIIILASGSPETFSYLRVLLSAGYWRISSLKESGINKILHELPMLSVTKVIVLNFNMFLKLHNTHQAWRGFKTKKVQVLIPSRNRLDETIRKT